ncbi:MAG: LacI family DNA-binding transcriptional regulator [Devosia sp.]|uniref:LacI family DNA-binding transcriptional regulator n=1 Tax=Devosia sp. TaxID=1871048 RepID=UPI0024CB6EA9|nr:LacI family DNA-binding transcriptional regulator [Devosia sp.]UYO00907.1 MAG: LacI family DNA-binding transcriptional regulator [Devosia sp.]
MTDTLNRTTLRDVARKAGVSLGTASKALNKSGTLRAETREKVLVAARELGFRPNDLAQALHRGQSYTVGLISNDSFGRFTMPIMEGLERVLHEEGIALFMCNATDDPAREQRHIDQLLGKRVDGLVFTGRRADRRAAPGVALGGVPALYVFAQSDAPGAACLLPDDEGGARLAVAHLLNTGRKRLAHVSGPEDFEAVRLRRAGFEAALAEVHMPVHPDMILHGAWSEAWGRAAARDLLNRAEPPDAIFAGNDQIARGILDTLHDRGLSVPGEIAVIGFDNWTIMAEAARPALTSIDMNLDALGEEAGRRIVRMIRGDTVSGITRLPCTLVRRASTTQ